MSKKKMCEKSLIDKFKLRGSNDPCPPRGKGTFKVANVCDASPNVYYTKTSGVSKTEFKEAIDDLYLPLTFPKQIQKYYMIPKCRISGVPKKTEMETAVVNKLTPVIDAMRILGWKNVIKLYLKFIKSYLSDISLLNPNDIWQVISTDFKVDNIMIDVSEERFYITDFTPSRANENGSFDLIMTPIFILGDDILEYDYTKKYSPYDISKLAYDICFLCILTSLFFMVNAGHAISLDYSNKDVENYAFGRFEDLIYSLPRKNTLTIRIQTMFDALDKSVLKLKEWNMLNPFVNKKSPKSVSQKSSGIPCHVFLKAMKSSSPTVINPLTGKKIKKKDQGGNPTTLVKKIMSGCQEKKPRAFKHKGSRSPCHVFLKAMKSSSPTVINPLTGKKINKKDQRGNPTALVRKIIKSCE